MRPQPITFDRRYLLKTQDKFFAKVSQAQAMSYKRNTPAQNQRIYGDRGPQISDL
jgi:hypothetical protein